MEKPTHKADQKIGKVFLVFAGVCVLALPLVVLSAFSYQPREIKTAAVEAQTLDFDQNGKAAFDSYDQISREYLEGASAERTLGEYYSRRQYLGSPPFIPHTIEEEGRERIECLACHAKGGWTEELKRNTPLTPHPEQAACRQCHVRMTADSPFVAIDWVSLAPPRLGRSYLPGAPPPIPHDLQMRGNCVTCHVGPSAVSAIRVTHASRGNCRQCHVPDSFAGLFRRESGTP